MRRCVHDDRTMNQEVANRKNISPLLCVFANIAGRNTAHTRGPARPTPAQLTSQALSRSWPYRSADTLPERYRRLNGRKGILDTPLCNPIHRNHIVRSERKFQLKSRENAENWTCT